VPVLLAARCRLNPQEHGFHAQALWLLVLMLLCLQEHAVAVASCLKHDALRLLLLVY
jgi:hypothetical protein